MTDPAVLVSDVTGRTPALAAAERWLAARGISSRTVELAAQSSPDELDVLDDGRELARIDEARRSLGSSAIIVGTGAGGTLALLALSALTGFRAAVCFEPCVHYPTLTDRRPAQPLDFIPGMAGALQAHFGESAPSRHVDALERRLDAQSRTWQVFRYPCPANALFDPDDPAGRMAWHRTERFLTQLTPGRRA